MSMQFKIWPKFIPKCFVIICVVFIWHGNWKYGQHSFLSGTNLDFLTVYSLVQHERVLRLHEISKSVDHFDFIFCCFLRRGNWKFGQRWYFVWAKFTFLFSLYFSTTLKDTVPTCNFKRFCQLSFLVGAKFRCYCCL